MKKRRRRRNKQAGKAILSLEGDRGQVLYPDGGAPPMKIRLPKHQTKMSDGYGSHMNGRHKLG
jgi:hypothetical protein